MESLFGLMDAPAEPFDHRLAVYVVDLRGERRELPLVCVEAVDNATLAFPVSRLHVGDSCIEIEVRGHLTRFDLSGLLRRDGRVRVTVEESLAALVMALRAGCMRSPAPGMPSS
jgi:hypothetical protein